MAVYHRTVIKNWKLSDVPNNPNIMFYYHIWNRNGWNNRFFANDILPVNKEVIRMIKTNNNLHLIIMNECEFETKQSLERLDKIVKLHKINPKKVWFIHNGEKLPEHKQELNASINVHASRSMSTSVSGTYPAVKYRTLKTPNQFFLCHNRSPRIHRYGLLCLLKKYNILDNTNWSLVNGWSLDEEYKTQFTSIFESEDILNLSDEKCGLGASFTTANISRHINEVGWRLKDVINYILIFVFGFIGIFILIYKSKLTSRFYILNLNLFSIIIFCSLPGLLLFLIAVDTGRWTSMLYHMIAISFFGMIKLGYVKLDSNIKYKYINFNKLKNNFLFYFLIFILCFGWSPKAVYHESFGTFPAYRMIIKAPKFFKINFKDPNHFFYDFYK